MVGRSAVLSSSKVGVGAPALVQFKAAWSYDHYLYIVNLSKQILINRLRLSATAEHRTNPLLEHLLLECLEDALN